MKRFLILTMAIIGAAVLQLGAVPARQGLYTFRQPDGKTFKAYLRGDEFCRILTTVDGCAIAMGSDGYYRYASYDASGMRHASEYRADLPAPASIMSASRNIPVHQIKESRTARRSKGITVSPAVRSGQTIRGLVILAQFPDLEFKNSHNRFVSLLNEKGYNYNNATGSAADYFNDQFQGVAQFSFDVSDVVTLKYGYAYYGENGADGFDKRAGELVAEACRLADSSVDFSQYDSDGDGIIDNVFIFVAGKDEAHGAGEDHIWSHAWSLRDGAGIRLSLDGKLINSYAISTELGINSRGQHIFTGIGTFCHEFSHVLGLSDYYDTDYDKSGGSSKALWGTTSLMDTGCYNNDSNTPPSYGAIERYELGLGDEIELEPGDYTLDPVNDSGRYGIVKGSQNGECYLLGYKNNEGWDKYIGGSGLLIYHIDMSNGRTGWSDTYEFEMKAIDRWYYNEVNCRPDHQCADLIEASPRATSISQVFWPYGNYNEFRPSFWDGSTPEMALTHISKTSNGVQFKVTGPIGIDKTDPFQTAAIIQWSCTLEDATCTIRYEGGGRSGEAQVKSYGNGKYSYTIEGLQPKTHYTVSVSCPGVNAVTADFTTMAFYSDGYPFIYMGTVRKNSGGSISSGSQIPLIVFNCSDSANMTWTMDGKKIQPDDDGYYKLEKDGTLKVSIVHNDGSTEVITKKLTVR